MKFAKELEQDLVPEWRVKYLNYKAGKKYAKGVARAINRANATTPRSTHDPPSFFRSPFPRHRGPTGTNSQSPGDALSPSSGPAPSGQAPPLSAANRSAPSEIQALNSPNGSEANYGSFVRTPAATPRLAKIDSHRTFELPGPAIRLPSAAVDDKGSVAGNAPSDRGSGAHPAINRSYSADLPTIGRSREASFQRQGSLLQPSSTPGGLRRLFSLNQQPSKAESAKGTYPLQALDTVRQREKEFFDFLDSELDKVETFYRQKELQAGLRLEALRDQLREMRDRRTQEVAEIRRRKEHNIDGAPDLAREPSRFDGHLKWANPIKSKLFKPGANSKALARMPQTPVVGATVTDARRDYSRRPLEDDVSYKTAKRKLKLALQEFYRGLELLKSYAVLNRTAFRKLNKKYDKTVNARPPYRYMNEKVNKAWFVNSEVIDGHIKEVEDLYARYFEGSNRKIAAGKLRRVNRRPSDESRIVFWNGLAIGVGAVLTIQGLVFGAQLLFDPDPTTRLQAAYLMQIYGGYFLVLLLFSLFCMACYFWTAHKINYPFIFEFDTRNNLDWRQLATFPSFFLLLFGLFFWLNFTRYGRNELWLYYPVILIFVSLLLIFFPAPILWHRSRQWLAYSHLRLFLAGLYPVEFRDFFLGDIYCSLTYATANVELFFCLYARRWDNPPMCNSSHSRLLGFFSTLPAIWRALQCIRRYYDTGNVFPHIVNCGKYIMTILSYVALSLYRIEDTHTNLVLFITFSTVNGIYTSVWDLFMDFSLLQPDARHPFLRDILGLKHRWMYYAIMVIDPILRFGWIFYAIFTHDIQHSTITSFLVSLSEVVRRGMWALLRVENEHCSNVAQYKASRDIPLPYDLPSEPLIDRTGTDELLEVTGQAEPNMEVGHVSGQDQRRPEGPPSAYSPARVEEGGLRRRRRSVIPRTKSIRSIIADAHKQDFEKKRRPPVEVDDSQRDESADELHSEDDEDDDTRSMAEERLELRHAETSVQGESSQDDNKSIV
ncbi:EXS family-domain-containing protein [Nemania sp. NC0429]|nr:EXS family-domain-containing protein [Nemania sp. NC0429]